MLALDVRRVTGEGLDLSAYLSSVDKAKICISSYTEVTLLVMMPVCQGSMTLYTQDTFADACLLLRAQQ